MYKMCKKLQKQGEIIVLSVERFVFSRAGKLATEKLGDERDCSQSTGSKAKRFTKVN